MTSSSDSLRFSKRPDLVSIPRSISLHKLWTKPTIEVPRKILSYRSALQASRGVTRLCGVIARNHGCPFGYMEVRLYSLFKRMKSCLPSIRSCDNFRRSKRGMIDESWSHSVSALPPLYDSGTNPLKAQSPRMYDSPQIIQLPRAPRRKQPDYQIIIEDYPLHDRQIYPPSDSQAHHERQTPMSPFFYPYEPSLYEPLSSPPLATDDEYPFVFPPLHLKPAMYWTIAPPATQEEEEYLTHLRDHVGLMEEVIENQSEVPKESIAKPKTVIKEKNGRQRDLMETVIEKGQHTMSPHKPISKATPQALRRSPNPVVFDKHFLVRRLPLVEKQPISSPTIAINPKKFWESLMKKNQDVQQKQQHQQEEMSLPCVISGKEKSTEVIKRKQTISRASQRNAKV